MVGVPLVEALEIELPLDAPEVGVIDDDGGPGLGEFIAGIIERLELFSPEGVAGPGLAYGGSRIEPPEEYCCLDESPGDCNDNELFAVIEDG
mgnify:CR=1 FL=1